jgi:hypothetical protein
VQPEPDLNAQWTECMLRGEFERAWQLSDRASGSRIREAKALEGRRVLLRCEHGLGDTIQFIRYARLLRPIAARVLAHVQPRMVPLVRGMPEIDFVFTWGEPWPRGEYDDEIEVMDLPHVFRTTLATIPADVPYLTVDPALVLAKSAAWRRPDRFNVGLCWSAGDWDAQRSIPLTALAPLYCLYGLALFSLQSGPDGPVTPDCTDTAAAIMNLDLVLTVDTMVAHLAGAMGKPVWLLLHRDANWRWMRDRDDSPWYPTMRLFRQDDSRDWTRVVEEVGRNLPVARSFTVQTAPPSRHRARGAR